ncbi:MAG: hypothetical protein JO113_06910 [Candidatus Eremiobacteraeota bacterium]|nr:hypothetical protein [Candidatus Eremiobacteraeota bacterium]
MLRLTLTACFVLVAGCSQAGAISAVPPAQQNAAQGSGELASASRYSQLYSFKGPTGAWPVAPLTYFKGKFYGTASAYGACNYGTVFSMTSLGRVHLLHTFCGKPNDSAYPEGGLAVMDRTLYGTTYYGGEYDAGTVFSITPAGVEQVIHSFGASNDGSHPASSLLPIGGVLYGTTQEGGRHNKGTVFAISPSGDERVLHAFKGAPLDGGHPSAGLIAVKNWFYGTTLAGGQVKAGGTVYRINALGQEKVLHAFDVRAGDGEGPGGALLYYGGALFGTTQLGGTRHLGTAFEMSTRGQEIVLHSFGKGLDGAFPNRGVIAVDGMLYGTTLGGGYSNRRYCSGPPMSSCGTIYRIDQLGRERVIYRFMGYPDGSSPYAALTNANGVLYGTTYSGGSSTYDGTIFRLLP